MFWVVAELGERQYFEMTTSQEMTIPKSPQDVIIQSVITAVIVFFAGLAPVNVFNRVAVIPSLFWLALITMILWTPIRQAGSFRRFLADCLGELIGRHFAEVVSVSTQVNEVRFGYELFGRRFIKQSIAINGIESIHWSTGQASSMTGRDMNDWSVYMYLDRDNPVNKPNRHFYTVSPARRKGITEAFGLSFVAFLRAAGAQLSDGETNNYFVSSNTEAK
jgi:hypothetical protein